MCVRIDSYESEKHQQWVRRFLNGRFENSVFCVLSPDGDDWVTRASRGPEMVLGRNATEQIKTIARQYKPKTDTRGAVVQDFHTFRQALNVASADQRVLVLISGPEKSLKGLRESLKPVANNPKIVGRFHFDFDSSDVWTKAIQGEKGKAGIVVIRPGEFGMKGEVMAQLPLDASNENLLAALHKANQTFAATTEKKVYSQHVSKGRQQGIYFEGAVPYGEDRDGDGQIDHGGGRRPRR